MGSYRDTYDRWLGDPERFWAEAAESGFNLGQLEAPIKPEYEQVLLNGNEAICLGAMASGLRFYVGYPISPATTILVYMERNDSLQPWA